MKKIIEWFKASNRGLHLLLVVVVGLLPTGGGTETGHSGNGYARITRLS